METVRAKTQNAIALPLTVEFVVDGSFARLPFRIVNIVFSFCIVLARYTFALEQREAT